MSGAIRRLAIVGASARAAAFSAMRAGYEVVAADLFADADLQQNAPAVRIEGYPEGLAAWLTTVDCDAWLYTGALENHPQLVDRLAAIRPLLGNCGDALRRVRDPLELRKAFDHAGLLFPETLTSVAGLPWDGSWLGKTYAGASGSGVWRLDGRKAANRAERERAVLQRFVPGEPAAAIFAVAPGGARLLGVARQLLGGAEHPWQYVGSIGPLDYGDAIERQLERLGAVLASAFGLRGLVGVDLVLDGQRAWVIEVNPRYTASVEILERATGLLAIAEHVAACSAPDGPPLLERLSTDDQDQRRSTPSARVHGKAIAYAPRTATILPSFFQWAMARAAASGTQGWLADIPHMGETIPAGRPILTVFAEGETIEECERGLRERLNAVETQKYGYAL